MLFVAGGKLVADVTNLRVLRNPCVAFELFDQYLFHTELVLESGQLFFREICHSVFSFRWYTVSIAQKEENIHDVDKFGMNPCSAIDKQCPKRYTI